MPVQAKPLRISKILYFILCLIAVLGNIYLFFLDPSPHSYGRDFKVYSAAVSTYISGGDPYSVAALQRHSGDFLPFTGSPLTLPVFFLLDKMDKSIGYAPLYWAFWAISLLFAYKSFRNNDLLYLLVLFFSGYWVFFLNVMTGNIELFMLLLFSAACNFYSKRGLPGFNISIGILTMFKVTPILFGLVPLAIRDDKRSRVRSALLLVGVFAALNGFSYLVFRQAYLRWLGQLFDPDFILGYTGGSGVSFFALANRFLAAEVKDPAFFAGVLHIMFSVIVIIGFVAFRRRVADRKAVFFFGILAAMLIMPRLKDYSFVYALLPIYYLTRSFNLKRRSFVLALCVLVPALSKSSIVSRLMAVSQISMVLDYAHLLSLICLFGYIYAVFTRTDFQLESSEPI